MALVGLVVTLGLYALGKIDRFDALLFSLFFVAIGTLWVRGFRELGKGTVELTHEGILVRGSGGRAQDFGWKDIAEVRVSSPSGRWSVDRLWTRVDGAGEDAPFVEVKLKRSRLPIVLDRYGTLWGIPGLGPKTLRLYVTDPEGLVRAAQPFLARPSDAGRI
jgi:hypothetical protein